MRKIKLGHKKLFSLFLMFILIQPMLDLFSYISVMTETISISLFIKPLFIFSLVGYIMLFSDWKSKKKYFIFLTAFGIYIIFHALLFYLGDFSVPHIIREIKYMVNIFYGVSILITTIYFYECFENKKEFTLSIIDSVMNVIIIFSVLIILNTLFSISTLTYEHADPYKLGFKGLFNNGSIIGHMFVLSLPIIIFRLFYTKNDYNVYLKFLIITLPLIVMYNIGTKVPYFSVFLIFLGLIVSELILKFIEVRKLKYTIIGLSIIVIALFAFGYKYSYANNNSLINQSVSEALQGSVSPNILNSRENMNVPSGEEATTELGKWYVAYWDTMWELDQVAKKYPSLDGGRTRLYQILYSSFMFKNMDYKYKLLGIGFEIQPLGLQPESDLAMSLFNFGIFGFLFMIGPYLYLYMNLVFKMIKNLRKINIIQMMLFISASSFFGISLYAGYTFMYTNYSIYLALIFGVIYSTIKDCGSYA